MAKQLHKRLSVEQVKAVLAQFTTHQMSEAESVRYLELGRARFYELVYEYRKNPDNFSLSYKRARPTRHIDTRIEENIFKELKTEKEKIIDNPDVPVQRYNYSYIKNLLQEKYGQTASLPTIIARAKDNGFWKAKLPKKIHDREVITNYAGELIQHDSSHHLFAPDAKVKWYLITSLDDHSRAILYADFVLAENTWAHISAIQSLILKYGVPLSYYVDQHQIFRYVKDRDKQTIWTRYTKFTDDVNPQWKMVLLDCGSKAIYALSPNAKGKIERPYQWLQDHVVRTCVREGVTDIARGRQILQAEVRAYNWQRVHSTTGEIPMIRFNRANKEKRTMFRPFVIPEPFVSAKDIFCLRTLRTTDAYRSVSLGGFNLKVPKVMPRQEVEIRLFPDLKTGITEVRFWHDDKLAGTQQVKNSDLSIVHL